VGWNFGWGIKMNHLGGGMNASVSSARGMDTHRVSQDLFQSSFNLLLDCAMLGLPLPSMKVSAQVLNYQGNSLSLQWVRNSHG
jgi:hypothetical protein